MTTKNITWNVTNKKGSADSFNVNAPNLEEALCDALIALVAVKE